MGLMDVWLQYGTGSLGKETRLKFENLSNKIVFSESMSWRCAEAGALTKGVS